VTLLQTIENHARKQRRIPAVMTQNDARDIMSDGGHVSIEARHAKTARISEMKEDGSAGGVNLKRMPRSESVRFNRHLNRSERGENLTVGIYLLIFEIRWLSK